MGDFIYVGYVATTPVVKKYQRSDLSDLATSPNYGGNIVAIDNDADYVYAGGYTTYRVRKYNKSDLSYVSQSANFGATIRTITVDGDYIYVALLTGYIHKLNRSDLSATGVSIDAGGAVYRAVTDATYIYVGLGFPDRCVKKFNKSTLVLAATSPAYGGDVFGLAENGDYIYAGGVTTRTVRKYNKSNLSYVSQSPNYGGTIRRLLISGSYVYVAGDTQNITRYNLSDLSYVDASPSYGYSIHALKVDDDYVYAGGSSLSRIRKYNKSDLSYDSQSGAYGTQINELSIDALPDPPTVTTQAATNVKATSATGNGNITDIGGDAVTAHGVCWNKTGTPTVADDHTDEGAAGVGAFTSEMTGLDTGDLYYYRAYATNSGGTSYGSEQTFTPDYTAPGVTTDAATEEAAESATLNGTLDDDGGQACTCGFEWGETVAYGNTTSTQSKNTGETFEQAISGLDPNTTYHFRAFATNDAGTTYGADRTFTTLGTAPEVTTNEASGIGQTGARLNGVIDNDGGLSCTVYFEYGLTTAYGTTTDVQTGKVTGDTFDELLYALQPGKEYHFRAVAYNSQGTTYGLDRTFHMAALSAKARNALNKAYATGRSET